MRADASRRVLLVNPRITSRRHVRFPLSIMTMAASLDRRYDATLIDANINHDAVRTACDAVSGRERRRRRRHSDGRAAGRDRDRGIASRARGARADVPIVWGGYFPTLYPDVALNSDYVDFAIRGQGEDTLNELLGALASGERAALGSIQGLSWRRDGAVVNNPKRALSRAHVAPALDYDLLGDARAYLVRTFLGARTAAHQAALGCRFRCTFCGVAATFTGATLLPPARQARQRSQDPEARDRRGLDPVLRSQLLRPRGRDGAAARGARASRAAVVVLCAQRRVDRSIRRIVAARAQEPSTRWPTSAPRPRTTGS